MRILILSHHPHLVRYGTSDFPPPPPPTVQKSLGTVRHFSQAFLKDIVLRDSLLSDVYSSQWVTHITFPRFPVVPALYAEPQTEPHCQNHVTPRECQLSFCGVLLATVRYGTVPPYSSGGTGVHLNCHSSKILILDLTQQSRFQAACRYVRHTTNLTTKQQDGFV